MTEERTTLFKLSKTGAILKFEVIARKIEDGAVLITRKGQLGGAEQEDTEPHYPKNVGRSNETTPYQQALIMYRSKVGKLKDKAYKEIEDWEDLKIDSLRFQLEVLAGTDANGNSLPMLAQKDWAKIHWPGYIQPKFDGVRSIIRKDAHGDLTIRSRRGKFFSNIDHILDQIPDNLPNSTELDGELYHHEKSLQQIVSMVKREQDANKQIGFRAYDILGPGKFKQRHQDLRHIIDKAGPSLIPTLTFKVEDWTKAWRLFRRFKNQGFEGSMWRNPEGDYGMGERSWDLIKIKDFEEEDFEIVGVEEATGRDEGTAIFVCVTEDEQEFRVRPMGTREERREYLDNFDEKYFGELLTVRFQNYTDGGIPFHARGITIRDYD